MTRRADGPSQYDRREIVYPHVSDVLPATAVKNVVLQSGLAQLKASPHYARYCALVDPAVIEHMVTNLPMSWTPMELASAHYQACEDLMLSAKQVMDLTHGSGGQLLKTALSSTVKRTYDPTVDVWNVMGALHRMWARLFQGGSIQVMKLGPNDMLFEQRAFVLPRYRYYQHAQLSAVKVGFEAVGARITTLKIATYSADRDELLVHVGWS